MGNGAHVLLLFVGMFTVGLAQIVNQMAVRSDIRFRFATTEVTCLMTNDHTEARDLRFNVTLPKEAFIFNFSMTIEGKDFPGHVKEKEKAKQTYDAAVQAGHSAGLVTQSARHSNQFEVSVNIAAGGNVTFNLQYQELLRRRFGVYEYSVYIDPSTPALDYSIEVYIQDRNEIKDVRTPAIRKDIINNEVEETRNSLTEIRNPSSTSAYVIYRPSAQELRELKAGWFVVQYDVESPNDAGELLVVDGYFVHFFMPPDDLPPLPLDIVFVLDVSGSMSGQKIEQLKDAMHEILDDLRETDRFNILLFDGRVEHWEGRLQEASENVVGRAHEYVRKIGIRGSTNIHSALMRGLELLQRSREASRVPVMFFLTDGEATAGVQDSKQIVGDVSGRNEGVVSVYSLAFGSGADYRLLRQISAKNKGFARKIYEGSDASSQVSGLYREISTVVMRNLTISYHNTSNNDDGDDDDIKIEIIRPTICDLSLLFRKSDFVVAGKLENADALLAAPGKAGGLGVEVSGLGLKNEINFVLEENDLSRLTLDGVNPPFWDAPRDLSKMAERTWAFLTIKQLLEQKVAAQEDEATVKELDKQILELSLKYNFVTSLTSMVVTRPEDDVSKSEGETASFVDDDDVRPGRRRGGGRGQFMMRRKFSRHQGLPQGSLGVPSFAYSSPHQPPSVSHGSSGIAMLPPVAADDLLMSGLNERGSASYYPMTHRTVRPLQPSRTTSIPRRFGTTTRRTRKQKISKNKRKGKKKCIKNKKVPLLHVTANGDKGCFELKAAKAPHNYTIFADPAANFFLTVELKKRLVTSILIRDNNSKVTVSVDKDGNLVFSPASTRATINVSSDKQQLSVGGGGHTVTVRVATQKCKATWLSININAGLTSVQGYGGITAMTYQDLVSSSNSRTKRAKKSKRNKKRRKSKKTKKARSCVSKSIPSDRSFILKKKKLLRYKA